MPFQLERAQNLFELSRKRPGVKMKTQPRELHGDCRSTGGRVMKSREINCATRERDRVHARMLRIIFVLVTQRRVDQVRRNFLKRRPDPEFLIGSERNSQEFPISVADDLRKWNPVEQWWFRQREPTRAKKCARQQQRSQYFPK